MNELGPVVSAVTRARRPCGNPRCSTSTAVTDQLTFGDGELSHCGYWERPCRVCAAHFEAADRGRGLDLKYPEWFPYWPEDGS